MSGGDTTGQLDNGQGKKYSSGHVPKRQQHQEEWLWEAKRVRLCKNLEIYGIFLDLYLYFCVYSLYDKYRALIFYVFRSSFSSMYKSNTSISCLGFSFQKHFSQNRCAISEWRYLGAFWKVSLLHTCLDLCKIETARKNVLKRTSQQKQSEKYNNSSFKCFQLLRHGC